MNFYCLGGLSAPMVVWTEPLCLSHPSSLGPLAQGCDLECRQQT